MPRLSHVGALLGIATLLPTPLGVQTSPSNSPRVERVVVRSTGATVEVEIQTSGAPVAPNTQAIAEPDRIVVDFPGALPAAGLRALKVNSGALKGIRAGLFFGNPPITRVVLDLVEPQSYRISTMQNAIIVKLGPVEPAPAAAAGTKVPEESAAPATVPNPTPPPPAVNAAPPLVIVTFENGMLRIRAEKATLAQVLVEVQRQTHAEIEIPAGAEQEEVIADLGPAPARDVLASLLNGSPYNFIFVGDELNLERVILTRRDSSNF